MKLNSPLTLTIFLQFRYSNKVLSTEFPISQMEEDTTSEDSFECYNCKRKHAHISKYCPEIPHFDRCCVCQKYVPTTNAHKVWCTNKSFISSPIEESTQVFKATALATFELSFVRNVKHISKVYHVEQELPSILPAKNVVITMDEN